MGVCSFKQHPLNNVHTLGWIFLVSPTDTSTTVLTNRREVFPSDVSTGVYGLALCSRRLTSSCHFTRVGPSSCCLTGHPMDPPVHHHHHHHHRPHLPAPSSTFFLPVVWPFCVAALMLMSINRRSFVFWRRGEERNVCVCLCTARTFVAGCWW